MASAALVMLPRSILNPVSNRVLVDMCTRTFGFAKDTGQFKGILKAVIHDVDELVYDEDAGGEVPAELILQRDFGKNERRPLRFGTIEDLPPY